MANKIDWKKINRRQHTIIDSDEALRDVTPLDLSENVLSGTEKIVITQGSIEDDMLCVKYEI